MMMWLRSLFFYLGLAVSVILLAVGCLVMWPFWSVNTRYDRIGRPWAKAVLAWLKWTCGVTHRVTWKGTLPDANQPIVVLAKHQSAWDPFVLGAELPYRLCFIYKKSLHWIPIFGWALMSMDMLAIDRSKGRESFQALVDKGREKVRHGWAVAIFPEGTRVPRGQHVRYKTGGARFAVQTESVILPVTYNSALCWPKNAWVKKPGVIDVVVYPAIAVSANDDPHVLTQEVESILEHGLAELP